VGRLLLLRIVRPFLAVVSVQAPAASAQLVETPVSTDHRRTVLLLLLLRLSDVIDDVTVARPRLVAISARRSDCWTSIIVVIVRGVPKKM